MDSPARSSQPAKMASSVGGTEGSSPASSPASATSLATMAAPKFGTLVPNRVFVGGISASTSEAELAQLFSAYGNVKATKIIADRGGVSKGYGFVTFETEEEAKRLQQESECIILRERKLNIAPAIKKQPFNRSFDGGTGSPPAVPTSTYYYTNGMGIPYQNGMTFYNTGAPAPGAAIAPPADPTTMYQAGLYGPQATPGHQTFAPMMYPMAPSLYLPQQYQYSPMAYDPYFPGTSAAGPPSYMYTSNGPQPQTSGNGSGNGSNGGTVGAHGSGSASGLPSMGHSQSQYPTHYYGPANSLHHPASLATGAHHGPPPPPPMEPIYYSYPPPPPHAQPSHHSQLALASDQLLLYTTDLMGQPQGNDSQISQEEPRPSNHAEQLQSNNPTTSDSGGGSGGGPGGGNSSNQSSAQSADPSNPSPPKYSSLTNPRYPNYLSIPQQASASQAQQAASDAAVASEEPACSGALGMHHYRIFQAPVYMQTSVTPYSSALHGPGASLLPTPTSQPYDKYRSDYSPMKPAGSGLVGSSPYTKGAPLIHQSPTYAKPYGSPGVQQPSNAHGMTGQQKYQAGRLPQQQQQYPKNRGGAGHQQQQQQQAQQQQQQQQTAFYYSPKVCQYSSASMRHSQSFMYRGSQISNYALSHVGSPLKSYASSGAEHSNRRSSDYSEAHVARQQAARQKSAVPNSYRGSNLTMSGPKSGSAGGQERTASPGNSSSSASSSGGSAQALDSSAAAASADNSATAASATALSSSNASGSAAAANEKAPAASVDAAVAPGAGPTPPPSPYSSCRTRPRPAVSPSPNNPAQVPVYGLNAASGQQPQPQQQQQQHRYSNSTPSLSQQQQQQQQQPQQQQPPQPHQQQQQQQQRGNGGRYQSSATSNRSGKSSNAPRQSSATGGGGGGGKYKVSNGIVQSGKADEPAKLGGAGDAPPTGSQLTLTPPKTPKQQSPSQAEQQSQQQIGETCHKMQALSL